MTFPSPFSLPLKLICYAFVQPCSFGRSSSTRLAGRVINHFCTRYAIFLCSFQYCQLLELYVKCAAIYRTFIPQSFWNTRCGRPWGRKFHLTRSLVYLRATTKSLTFPPLSIARYSLKQLSQLGRQWRERKCPIFKTVAILKFCYDCEISVSRGCRSDSRQNTHFVYLYRPMFYNFYVIKWLYSALMLELYFGSVYSVHVI